MWRAFNSQLTEQCRCSLHLPPRGAALRPLRLLLIISVLVEFQFFPKPLSVYLYQNFTTIGKELAAKLKVKLKIIYTRRINTTPGVKLLGQRTSFMFCRPM